MRNLMMLLLLIGCGGTEVAGKSALGETCPATQPANGDACAFSEPFCYYHDACTQDGTGVIATCHDGKVELGYNQIYALCPEDVPAEGAACPCSVGGRQQQPCHYDCGEGGQLTATCYDGKWMRSAPSTCTPGTKL